MTVCGLSLKGLAPLTLSFGILALVAPPSAGQCSGGPPLPPPGSFKPPPPVQPPKPTAPPGGPGPNTPGPNTPGPNTPNPYGPTTPDAPGPGPLTPSDRGLSGPVTPGSPGPVTPGWPSGGGLGRSIPRTAAGLLDFTEAEPWMKWWEVNRTRFFHRVLRPRAPVTPEPDNPASFRPERNRLGIRAVPGRPFFDRHAALVGLIPALSDESLYVRSASALALGKVGGDRTIGPLVSLLSDPVVRVRETAALGLGFAGGEAARLALEDVFTRSRRSEASARDADHALAFAALGLGLAGDTAAVPALSKVLAEEESPEVRCAAARALGLLGSPEAYPALFEAIRSDRSPLVRAYAATAVGRLGSPEGLSALLVATRAPAKTVRRAAVLAIGEVARSTDEEALDRLVEIARRDSDAVSRGYAALSLGEIGGERAWKTLVHLLSHGQARMRPWAALGLGIHAVDEMPAETGRVLEEAFEAYHKDARTGAAIAFALGLARTQSAAAEVRKFFDGIPDALARLCTIDARILLGEKNLLPDAPFELGVAPELERAKLVGLFARIHDDMVLGGHLSSLAQKERNEEVAVAAAFGVGYTGDRSQTKAMESILADGRMPPSMRAAAAFSLGSLAEEERWPLLVSVRWGEEVTEDQVVTMRELRDLP